MSFRRHKPVTMVTVQLAELVRHAHISRVIQALSTLKKSKVNKNKLFCVDITEKKTHYRGLVQNTCIMYDVQSGAIDFIILILTRTYT